jgi:YidC/Oxa1 family membrane protein insertase
VPASPGADPVSLLAWIFTPVFQAIFILMAALDAATSNIAVAIVLLTLIIRVILVPVFRNQTVSQRRIQLIQPELREIARRHRGDRAKISEAQMALYRERGINPASGCLPLILQFVLLIPMYSVISNGLTNFDPSAMVTLFGFRLPILECSNVVNGIADISRPCIDPIAFGVDWSRPETLIPLPLIGGLSVLAVVSALLQMIQSRMMLSPIAPGETPDQAAVVQRQTMLLFPIITIFYGGFLPAGLFLYWIVTTVFSIVQQYLIVGYGSLFPLFGRTPGFAVGHTPRFPVAMPVRDDDGTRGPGQPGRTPTSADRAASAAATIRSAGKSRTGRRGRKR